MWRIALAFVVLLAACGKDGGGGNRVGTVLEGLGVAAQLSNIIVTADTLIIGDVVSVKGDDTPSVSQYDCAGFKCEAAAGAEDDAARPLHQDLSKHVIDPDIDYGEATEISGVQFARYSVRQSRGDVTWNYAAYGAWLKHSAFESLVATTQGQSVTWQTAYNVSFGDQTGQNPDGNAEWTGLMFGSTRARQPFRPLRGGASLEFELATGELDVEFTDIVYMDTNEEFTGSITFPGITVRNGAFSDRGTAHISGKFYGPNHAEVGGVFTHPLAVGAFGAKKNPTTTASNP